MLKPLLILFAIKFFISFSAFSAAASGANRCILLFVVHNRSNPEIFREKLQSRFQLEVNTSISSQNIELQIASRLLQPGEILHSRYGGRLDGLSYSDPASLLIRQIIKHYQERILPLAEVYEGNREEIILIKSALAEQSFLFKNNFTPLVIELVELLIAQVRQQ